MRQAICKNLMSIRLHRAQVTVLDGDSKPVPQGKIGEVCLRGPNVTKGYLNRPEANEEVLLLGLLPFCPLALQCLARTVDGRSDSFHVTLRCQRSICSNCCFRACKVCSISWTCTRALLGPSLARPSPV